MLLVADSHIGLESDNPPGNLIPLKLKDIKNVYKEVILYAAETNQELVVCGDVFETDNPRSYVITVFIDILKLIVKHKVKAFFITGNHDAGIVFNCLDPIKKAFSYYGNIFFITDEPKNFNLRRFNVLFVPHIQRHKVDDINKKYGSLKNYIYEKTREKSFDIIIGHAFYDHFKSSNGEKILSSGSAMVFNPTDWPDFKIAGLGHIHKPQEHKFRNKFILSPGSMITNDFSERVDKKGFYEIKNDLTFEFKPFKTSVTQYAQIKIDLINNQEFQLSDIELKEFEGKLIKVVVYSDSVDKIDEPKIRKILNNVGYVIRFKRVIQKINSISESRQVKLNLKNINYINLLKKWVDEREGISDDIKKTAIKIGKEYLETYEALDD